MRRTLSRPRTREQFTRCDEHGRPLTLADARGACARSAFACPAWSVRTEAAHANDAVFAAPSLAMPHRHSARAPLTLADARGAFARSAFACPARSVRTEVPRSTVATIADGPRSCLGGLASLARVKPVRNACERRRVRGAIARDAAQTRAHLGCCMMHAPRNLPESGTIERSLGTQRTHATQARPRTRCSRFAERRAHRV
jgi:hypothetical protein